VEFFACFREENPAPAGGRGRPAGRAVALLGLGQGTHSHLTARV
jgi:hypothetical protein